MFDGFAVMRSPDQLRSLARAWHAAGDSVALIPVLGSVADRHLELVREARAAGHRVAACLVDLDSPHPARDLHADARLLEQARVDAIISPDREDFCPEGYRTRLRVAGLSDVLCGQVEQGCFDRAVLVMLRMINQVRADLVCLSEAQWQFAIILSQLAGDLDLDTEICIRPVRRGGNEAAAAPDIHGLPHRTRDLACEFERILAGAAQAIKSGCDPRRVCGNAEAALSDAGFDAVDYIELRHAGTLARVQDTAIGGPSRLFASARLGELRLVDNQPVV